MRIVYTSIEWLHLYESQNESHRSRATAKLNCSNITWERVTGKWEVCVLLCPSSAFMRSHGLSTWPLPVVDLAQTPSSPEHFQLFTWPHLHVHITTSSCSPVPCSLDHFRLVTWVLPLVPETPHPCSPDHSATLAGMLCSSLTGVDFPISGSWINTHSPRPSSGHRLPPTQQRQPQEGVCQPPFKITMGVHEPREPP